LAVGISLFHYVPLLMKLSISLPLWLQFFEMAHFFSISIFFFFGNNLALRNKRTKSLTRKNKIRSGSFPLQMGIEEEGGK
jgi:hypothetical protein